MKNTFKTFALMAGLMALFLFVGSFFGNRGWTTALILGSLFNLGAYWFSDKIILGMNHAKPVDETHAPGLYCVVRQLAEIAQIPMPKVYIINMPTPNAFATGRNPKNAAVAVSPALMEMLSAEELKGVLAHELSHVKNRDVLIATIAACVAGAISYLAHMAQWAAIFGGGRDDRDSSPLATLALIIVAPLAALFIQLAISRSREYEADASGARLTGQPLALAGALKKIHAMATRHPVAVEPATASLYIANPLAPRNLMKLFSTHPPMEERVKRLEALAYGVAA